MQRQSVQRFRVKRRFWDLKMCDFQKFPRLCTAPREAYSAPQTPSWMVHAEPPFAKSWIRPCLSNSLPALAQRQSRQDLVLLYTTAAIGKFGSRKYAPPPPQKKYDRPGMAGQSRNFGPCPGGVPVVPEFTRT